MHVVAESCCQAASGKLNFMCPGTQLPGLVPVDDIHTGGLTADKFSTLPQSKEPLTMNFLQFYGNFQSIWEADLNIVAF